MKKVILDKVPSPVKDCTLKPVEITDKTIEERRTRMAEAMKQRGIDAVVIYGDLEHGSNFEYFTGFLPRFEEALLVLRNKGEDCLILGNENLNKAGKSRIAVKALHSPLFSLPNQPMKDDAPLKTVLSEAGISAGQRVGIIGWKMFTSKVADNYQMFDVPAFIIEAVKEITADVVNAADLMIGGEAGIRTVNNANEIASYEFFSSLASDCMLDAMNQVEIGVSEMELGDRLNRYGQRNSVVTIAAAGPRFIKANMYPTDRQVVKGVPISLTVGYRGGLSSRGGFAVNDESELPEGQKDYVEKVVVPYFNTVATWLEKVHVGMTGGEVYDMVEEVLPKKDYHWSLCPGHLTGFEEWVSSPVYDGSEEVIKSGMIFQTDIIPSVPGYDGTNAESTVAVADEKLQEEIREQYPDLWERMMARRKYIKEVLGINIHPDLLPMASTLAYLRPHLLNKEAAMAVRED